MVDKIGKYEILKKIGTGGFGVVYQARDPLIKRVVAIKTCEVEDEEIKRRFYREAELAGNLHHPNITVIYDFGVENGIPYIVQEFLSGEDLDKINKRGVSLTLRRKVEILMEVSKGLTHAHQCGVVHRDVKPSNIRITKEGNVKIMDFGIAKSSSMASKLTQTGITLGTAAYLAPEQIKGSSVDPRTDIFSFGVMMYELFTGVKPFAGENISQIIYQIINVEPTPPTQVLPDLPIILEQIILKCLVKERNKRYGTFEAVYADLRKVLAQFTRMNIDDVVIEPTTQRPTRPIAIGGSEEKVTQKTPTWGVPPHRSSWLKIIMILIGAVAMAALGLGYLALFPSQPEVSMKPLLVVHNPVKMATKEEGLPDEVVLDPPPIQPASTPLLTPKKALTGTVKVTSNKRCQIAVDGFVKGSIPPPITLSLSPGKHKISWISKAGSHREDVTVKAGKARDLGYTFVSVRTGRLSVITPVGSPFGYVYVDGKKVGTTPLNGYKLPVGMHRIEVKHKGYKTFRGDVKIKKGTIANLPVKLIPME